MRRCAIISPDKVFHPPACGGGLVSSPPSAMPVISQDTRRTTAKQARTMIGLQGSKGAARVRQWYRLSLSVYWSAPPQVACV